MRRHFFLDAIGKAPTECDLLSPEFVRVIVVGLIAQRVKRFQVKSNP